MLPVIFLSVDQVLAIHRRVIQEFGGDSGLRDRGLLESAIAMPQSSFEGEDLHGGLAEKAAAYHYHICANHAFIDGNKRVAVATAEVFLLLNGLELGATDDEVEEITMGLAGGRISKDQVTEFYVKFVIQAG